MRRVTAVRRLWGKLTLRWQAAFAVLAPCTALALVAALYFPRQLNAEAESALLQRARTLGALAAAACAPTLKLIGDGLGRGEDLDSVFQGALGGSEESLERSDVLWMAVLKVKGDAVAATPGTVVRRWGAPQTEAELNGATFAVPRRGARRNFCEIDNADHLLVRCLVKDRGDDALEGLFLAALDKSHLRKAQADNFTIGVWTGLGAIAVALLLAFLFSGALADPVRRVTQAAREVASGDVTVNAVEVEAAGELRSMAQSFNEMLASLRTLVGQMVSLTGQLSAAAGELLSASTEHGELALSQSSHAHQIAATFEELSRSAQQISSAADTVEEHARSTREEVENARAVFTQLVADINATRTESKTFSASIEELNSELREVAKIAQLINSFADRSDLLALNAALEGTKAGPVGAGFSLVAVEWRRLSEHVAASALDIERIIAKVQTLSRQALDDAQKSVVTSDRRATLADLAATKFEQIFVRARGTSATAQQISLASKEQRRTSEDAANGAQSISALVKRGVDATRRTQTIAEQLRSVAGALSQVTQRFKVKSGP